MPAHCCETPDGRWSSHWSGYYWAFHRIVGLVGGRCSGVIWTGQRGAVILSFSAEPEKPKIWSVRLVLIGVRNSIFFLQINKVRREVRILSVTAAEGSHYWHLALQLENCSSTSCDDDCWKRMVICDPTSSRRVSWFRRVTMAAVLATILMLSPRMGEIAE